MIPARGWLVVIVWAAFLALLYIASVKAAESRSAPIGESHVKTCGALWRSLRVEKLPFEPQGRQALQNSRFNKQGSVCNEQYGLDLSALSEGARAVRTIVHLPSLNNRHAPANRPRTPDAERLAVASTRDMLRCVDYSERCLVVESRLYRHSVRVAMIEPRLIPGFIISAVLLLFAGIGLICTAVGIAKQFGLL